MVEDSAYKPYNSRMLLARVDKSNQRFPLEFIKGKHTLDDDQLSICADLIAGEYYFLVEVDLPARPI